VSSTNHLAPRYVISSISPLPRPSFILYTIKLVYCQCEMFRPLLVHLQDLWENRSKNYLYSSALWYPKCLQIVLYESKIRKFVTQSVSVWDTKVHWNRDSSWILCILDRASLWYLKNERPTWCHNLFLFHFFNVQHVSDINTSIMRSLRLFYCITTLVVYSCEIRLNKLWHQVSLLFFNQLLDLFSQRTWSWPNKGRNMSH